MVAVLSDSQAAIRRAAHLKPAPGQRLATRINRRVWNLLAHSIATKIHWVPEHFRIHGNAQADRQANLARDASGSTVIKPQCNSAPNWARRISEGRSAAKVEWEADKCSKHFSHRLKGKAGTKRPIPMTSVKLLAARFYQLKSRHAPTGVYLKRFGHRDDYECWWCGGTVAQMREHLFRHCSRWKDQQKTLWRTVGQTTGWKVGRCRHMQISELFTIEECDQAVKDFLVATEVGIFPPKTRSGIEQAEGLEARGRRWRQRDYTILSFILSCHLCLSLTFHLTAGTKGSGGGAAPSSRLARRQRGYQGPGIL